MTIHKGVGKNTDQNAMDVASVKIPVIIISLRCYRSVEVRLRKLESSTIAKVRNYLS